MLIEPRCLASPASIRLLPGRVAFLPDASTMLVADLHLGKAASFRRAGLPVPEGSAQGDLVRLRRLVADLEPRRVIVLGDLFHAPSGCTPAVFDEFAEVRRCFAGVELILVEGNHDRRVRIPETLGVDRVVSRLDEPPWVFLHEPPGEAIEGCLALCGHLHPRLSIRSPSGDRLTQRCFVEWPGVMVLPAFGSFTGSAVVTVTRDTRLWAAGDDAVVDVTRMARMAAGIRSSAARGP
jgi:DNA ligase-associated metallophosphoesterase